MHNILTKALKRALELFLPGGQGLGSQRTKNAPKGLEFSNH